MKRLKSFRLQGDFLPFIYMFTTFKLTENAVLSSKNLAIFKEPVPERTWSANTYVCFFVSRYIAPVFPKYIF
ncbi:MAG: hypothetical protein AMJ91_01690 [candidate division Zixibacteria bacterium SM23_73_3]|nr:MAG: hypothetical protein AMJ91_01690 [candidate division Zixibacteria bacterium SM23_73_3]